MSYPALPWKADQADRDDELFRVIRGKDGRPIMFVSKWLSATEQEDITRLVISAPTLLTAMRQIFFDPNVELWSEDKWTAWRKSIGITLGELWPTDWTAP